MDIGTRMVRLDAGPPQPNGYLIVIRGPAGDRDNRPGKAYALGRHVTLGRQHGNSIVLADATVSREHCSIGVDGGVDGGADGRVDGARYRLRDPASANGTLVNGTAVRDGELGQSADIVVGAYQLFFWDGSLRDDVLSACLRQRGVRVLSLI